MGNVRPGKQRSQDVNSYKRPRRSIRRPQLDDPGQHRREIGIVLQVAEIRVNPSADIYPYTVVIDISNRTDTSCHYSPMTVIDQSRSERSAAVQIVNLRDRATFGVAKGGSPRVNSIYRSPHVDGPLHSAIRAARREIVPKAIVTGPRNIFTSGELLAPAAERRATESAHRRAPYLGENIIEEVDSGTVYELGLDVPLERIRGRGDESLADLDDRGVDAINLASHYHSIRAFQPRFPGSLFVEYPAGCSFDPEPERFDGTPIDPLQNEIDGVDDLVADTVDRRGSTVLTFTGGRSVSTTPGSSPRIRSTGLRALSATPTTTPSARRTPR